MKRDFIKQVQLIAMFVAISAGFLSCSKSVLNTTDQNGVNPAIWDVQSSANEFLNGTYDLVMPNWPVPGSIHNTSDELNNATASILNGTLTGSGNEITDIESKNGETTDVYWWIYRCNLAIQGINSGAMAPSDKALLKGQFFFLRGYVYFTMIRIYGGVPLITQPQDPSNLQGLYTPRSKTSLCVQQISADMDSAAALLPATWTLSTDGGRINRATAMAFKGKTCCTGQAHNLTRQMCKAAGKMPIQLVKRHITRP